MLQLQHHTQQLVERSLSWSESLNRSYIPCFEEVVFSVLLASPSFWWQLDEGTPMKRGSSEFGRLKFDRWKYLIRDMILCSLASQPFLFSVEKNLANVCAINNTCNCLPHPFIRGENFRGWAQLLENSESFLPRKFPAIRCFLLSYPLSYP